MASLAKENDRGRKGWRLRFYENGKRRSLWIGDVSKRIADAVAYNVDRLVQAKANGQRPDAASVDWSNDIDDRLRKTLVRWQRLEPITNKRKADSGRLLGPFLDAYIEGRTDVRASTVTNYKQVRRLLLEYFKADRSLHTITAADADRWRRWLLGREVKSATDDAPAETMAIATVSKHVKRAKTVFTEAVRDRLIDSSPFSGLKGGNEANKDRQEFIDRVTTDKVLSACPDHDWKAVFALARFAGLRCRAR